MKIAISLLLLTSLACSQTPGQAPAGPAASSSPNTPALGDLLTQVQISAMKSDQDVAALRIDRWKTEAAGRQQAQASAASIRRNLTYAIPDLLQRIQASPGSLNANFRLYRNLNALYDTFSALAESAGAFGPKEQYAQLADDVAQLDRLRHDVADRVDSLAGANDAELARLRSQLATPGGKAPSRVVVDDQQAPAKKKPKPKPKPATPPPASQ
jgi:hypothetical protein